MSKKESPQFLSRRDFLQLGGAGLVVFLASCGPTEIFEPTITSTQAESAATEVIEPSPTEVTPTLEPTPEVEEPDVPYKVEEGTVMEWRDGKWREASLPEGVGEIALVEQHEGSWYGISDYDRAVVTLNEVGEWESFERPVKIIAPHQFSSGEIERLSQEEIEPEEEMRILDAEGNVIDFGFLYEKPLEHNPSVTYAYFSCLVRGAFGVAFGDDEAINLVLEFPLRYERQIVTIWTGSVDAPSFNKFIHLYLVPESGTIEDAERTRTSGDEFLRRFGDPLASGSQIVIALDVNQQTPDTEAYQRDLRKLISSLQEGRAVSLDQLFMLNEIWVDERVFK